MMDEKIISFLLALIIFLPMSSTLSIQLKKRSECGSLKTPYTIPQETPISNIIENNQPFYFVKNEGQLSEKVYYYAKIKHGNIYLTTEGMVYQYLSITESQGNILFHEKSEYEVNVENIRISFVGVNGKIKLEGLEESEARFNYYRGNDTEKWVNGARTYHKVIYHDLYPRIDLIVYGSCGEVKLDYIIKVGGDSGNIVVRYEGARRLGINEKGQLEVETEKGLLIEDVPVSYQVVDGQRVEVKTHYTIDQTNDVRLEIGDYRRDKYLVVDPTLIYSTYIGGGYNNYGAGIVVDGSGNAYVAGWTDSSIYPTTPGAYDTSHNGAWDVFITKIDPTGQSLVYSTYLGGSGEDWCNGIAIDSSGNAYITGYTYSNDFPTNAYDTNFNGGHQDAYIAKIDPTGQSLVYSTYLGGNNNEDGYGIAVDGDGNAYVTGYTLSSDFPVTNDAYDTSYNGYQDAYVTKIDPTGQSLVYSTYLGGSGGERGYGIAVDGAGNTYVTGWNWYGDFPTSPGAYDTSFNGGDSDVFITKINSTGRSLVYSTYFGGSGGDRGYGIAIDGSRNAYITGLTSSTDFPTTLGAYDTNINGNWDVFVTRINPSGTAIFYSTYLGGNGRDLVNGIAVDRSGNAYVAGWTNSTNYPTTSSAYDTSDNEDWDGFVSKISLNGQSLSYSTYLGGRSIDYISSIAIDHSGNAYVTGYTVSSDFPTTPGAYNTYLNSGPDLFVTVLVIIPTFTWIPGATPSSPALVATSSELHMVVRGTDNGIYHKVINMTSGTWTVWTRIPGATNDVPAAIILDGRLHIVVRGTENGIYHCHKDLSTGAWSAWVNIPGATVSAPAITASSGMLHLVVRGTDNGIYYAYWTVSSGWSTWQHIPGATNDVPTITTLGNKLHLLVRGTDNGIYHKTMELSTRTWSGWANLLGATTSSPVIVISGEDRLDLVVRGTDNGIYHKVWRSGTDWDSTWEHIAGATNDRPTLLVVGNTLHLAVRGVDNGIYIKKLDLSSGNWSGYTHIIGATSSYPVLTAPYYIIHMAIRGTDNGIYYAYWT